MRAEISQAKREANFYMQNAEKNERLKKREKKQKKKTDSSDSVQMDRSADTNVGNEQDKIYSVRLKEPEDEIIRKRKQKDSENSGKGRKKMKAGANSDSVSGDSQKKKAFLTKIFAAGVGSDSEEES